MQITKLSSEHPDAYLNDFPEPVATRWLQFALDHPDTDWKRPLTVDEKLDELINRFDQLMVKLDKVIDWDILENEN